MLWAYAMAILYANSSGPTGHPSLPPFLLRAAEGTYVRAEGGAQHISISNPSNQTQKPESRPTHAVVGEQLFRIGHVVEPAMVSSQN